MIAVESDILFGEGFTVFVQEDIVTNAQRHVAALGENLAVRYVSIEIG